MLFSVLYFDLLQFLSNPSYFPLDFNSINWSVYASEVCMIDVLLLRESRPLNMSPK